MSNFPMGFSQGASAGPHNPGKIKSIFPHSIPRHFQRAMKALFLDDATIERHDWEVSKRHNPFTKKAGLESPKSYPSIGFRYAQNRSTVR
jgi:hypothetical protein